MKRNLRKYPRKTGWLYRVRRFIYGRQRYDKDWWILTGALAFDGLLVVFGITNPHRIALKWAAEGFFAAIICVCMVVVPIGFVVTKGRRPTTFDDRRGHGLCGKCGYDLRAATTVYCPECGAYHGSTPGKRRTRQAALDPYVRK